MAIRIRKRDAATSYVALCAAQETAEPGDLYLDDAIHYALAEKFRDDYEQQLAEARKIITGYRDGHLGIPSHQVVGFPSGLVDDGCRYCENARAWLAANPEGTDA